MIRSPYPRTADDRTAPRGTSRDHQQDRRRVGPVHLAAVSGLASGAARAAVDWLLQHHLGA